MPRPRKLSWSLEYFWRGVKLGRFYHAYLTKKDKRQRKRSNHAHITPFLPDWEWGLTMTVKWLECKEGSGQVAERAGILVNKEIILSSFENKEIALSWSQNKWTQPVLKLVLTSPLIRALVVLFTTAIPSPKINAKTYQCSHQQLRRAHINLAKIWSRLSSQPSDFGSQYIYAVLVAAGPFLWSSVDRFLLAYD